MRRTFELSLPHPGQIIMSVRILIAEDSAIFAAVLQETLHAEPDLEVVAIARDGMEAVDLCARLKPDIVLMDIQMPRLDGLTATEHIMGRSPTPILVITSDPIRGGVD
ncbi:MAG: response regulator, partial [Bradymonadaceae bacterium]